jgi:hypothetical protein
VRNSTAITNDQLTSVVSIVAYFKLISLHLPGETEEKEHDKLRSGLSVSLQIIKPETSRLRSRMLTTTEATVGLSLTYVL